MYQGMKSLTLNYA
jgi:Ran GTPase-activating protein (RanGAP) involved in mRNA processing and transport